LDVYTRKELKSGVNDSGAFTAPLFVRGNRRDYDH
jgi:hypothetical protein